jgi:mRNA interferase MazF
VNGRTSKAMADQLMSADKTRLKSRIGMVGYSDLAKIEQILRFHLGL